MKTASTIISGRELFCVTMGTSVFGVIEFMAQKNIGAVVIVDNPQNKKLLGIFSERDLLKRVVLAGLDTKKTLIDAVMTKNVAVGFANETYESCLNLMKKIKSRHLPIVDGDRLIGMVSLRDLLEVEVEEKDAELRMMNAYIHDMPQM